MTRKELQEKTITTERAEIIKEFVNEAMENY
jgi:hypothetical protein